MFSSRLRRRLNAASRRLRATAIGVALVLGLAPLASAAAAISPTPPSSTGAITFIAKPADARQGKLVSKTELRAWYESQRVPATKQKSIAVDVSAPGTYDVNHQTLTPIVLKDGFVNSLIIHGDANRKPAILSGTIYLATPVRGIIVQSIGLNHSDRLGPCTRYASANTARGLDYFSGDPNVKDSITLSDDRLHVDVTMGFNGALDEVRIITEATQPTAGNLFYPGVTYSTGSGPNKVVVGDFNGDGIADLATPLIFSYQGAVSILMGNGDGTYQPAVNYATGPANPHGAASGDFNRDGKLDLVVGIRYWDGSQFFAVGILIGNGDGSFQAPVLYPGLAPVWDVGVADLNGDAIADLVVANDGYLGAARVAILLGNGDGTFGQPAGYGATGGATSVAIADFNHDGKRDLVTSTSNSSDVSVLLGNGNGTFQGEVNYAAGGSPQHVNAGDLNRDGRPDLAVANFTSDVSVLLDNATGTFQTAATFPAASGNEVTFQAAVGDFNADGKADLAVANGSPFVSILAGDGNGSFAAPDDYGYIDSQNSVTVADLNCDGQPDLALALTGSDQVAILLAH